MIQEKYKWLYAQTIACTGGNMGLFERVLKSEKINNFLKGNFSREKVRDYFMDLHNTETIKGISDMKDFDSKLKYLHLEIPYEILQITEKGVFTSLTEPFYEDLPIPLSTRTFNNKALKQIKELGLLERELRKGDILLSHCFDIADVCSSEELKKYKHLYEFQEVLL